MKEFLGKHPALAEAGDSILALLSGRFALAAAVARLRERRSGPEGHASRGTASVPAGASARRARSAFREPNPAAGPSAP